MHQNMMQYHSHIYHQIIHSFIRRASLKIMLSQEILLVQYFYSPHVNVCKAVGLLYDV